MQMTQVAMNLEMLLDFSKKNKLIYKQDVIYHRNLLLDAMGLSAPPGGHVDSGDGDLPMTATPMLSVLCDYAVGKGLIGDTVTQRELFSARLMGLLTPHPAMVRKKFNALNKDEGADVALNWFYKMQRDNDYIRVDQINKNIRYFKNTDAGELEITINLSKPEKDRKK